MPHSSPTLALPSVRLPARPRGLAAWAGLSLPLLFILLWSSGYVAGKLALPFAGPYTLLSLRFGLAALFLLGLSVLSKAPWPRGRAWLHLAVVGLLVQGLHFIGVYQALRLGLPAGVAALAIGLMPLATAFAARLWLGERLGPRQGLALLGGLGGVLLVVAAKPMAGAAGWAAYGAALLGLLGLVLGSLYQKQFCANTDLRSGSCVQLAVAALLVAGLAGAQEGFAMRWHWQLGVATLWLALVNSIGAFSLMFVMLRRGSAGAVARLFFLIPGVSALLGWLLLGEHLSGLALMGFALSGLSVAWAARR
ncbi:drug/metabolite transporter (DMT)-like permease [Paucibacter oligotrophus]|uniref:Drug/metabolite transporter (DMT)-like permease n=1 Tax=Roseateles oligotrophus TaxID=1769250 RepID=A0A840LAX0_9BURK|nr:DMT family transporter [Roseateles oligotrophus]MBB4843955.1 drug/metabolite transporter (DMT)-like permease [Roseateles oligotrophus]